jgi:nucleoside-diphosphate-sugar epimerase
MLHIMDNVVEASGLTGATVVFPGDMVGLKPVSEVPLPVETLPRDANDRPCRKGSLRNMLEDQLHQNADIRNIRTLIVRSGDQFGERSDGWVMGAMFRAALRGEPIPWFVSADVPHVFTWTDDVARVAVGYLLAPSRPVFEIAHVAGHTIPNAETWGRALAAAAGVGFGGVKVTRPWKLRLRGLLDAESREYAELLYLWEAPFFLDDSRTRALLPDWSPTPLDAALQATMAWFRG